MNASAANPPTLPIAQRGGDLLAHRASGHSWRWRWWSACSRWPTTCKTDGGKFATLRNAQNVLVQSATVAVAALGMTMIIISGGIDLSAGTTMALCATVLAWFLREGYSPAVAVAAGTGHRLPGRLRQWHADQPAAGRAVHRHAGHDDDLPGPGQDHGQQHHGPPVAGAGSGVDEGVAQSASRATSGWSFPPGVWLLLALALLVVGGAALHGVRPARVRHRLERVDRPAVRHQRCR